jgi:nicotinate-nucleotide--dimethylbenzimidazole phosphoribosyltransferase
VRERALQSQTLTDRRSITLPLCVLAAGAIHGLAVMALLPMMITLPGPGAVQQDAAHAVDVDVMPASAAAPPVLVPHDPETTASLPEAEDHPVPAPDRDAIDAGGDEDAVPAEPGIAAVPEPRIEPAVTIVTPAAVRIPEPLLEAVESAPAVSDPPVPAAEDASPSPEVEATAGAPTEETAVPVAGVEPARLESPAAETTPAAAEPARPEPEPEADAVEEDVPPAEAEAAKEIEPQPEAKVEETPPPIPALKPAKSAEPKARALAPQKKASATSAKRGASRARRSVRTRTVTKTQGGLFQDLFGPPQPAKGATSRRSTTER